MRQSPCEIVCKKPQPKPCLSASKRHVAKNAVPGQTPVLNEIQNPDRFSGSVYTIPDLFYLHRARMSRKNFTHFCASFCCANSTNCCLNLYKELLPLRIGPYKPPVPAANPSPRQGYVRKNLKLDLTTEKKPGKIAVSMRTKRREHHGRRRQWQYTGPK